MYRLMCFYIALGKHNPQHLTTLTTN